MDFRDLRLGERLRELNVRDWLEENQQVATIGAVVLLVIALGVLVMTMTGGRGSGGMRATGRYFYDLNTGERFVVPLDAFAPIEHGDPYELPNGQTMPAGVEAMVFTCGGSRDPEDQVLGWVEFVRPDVHAQVMEEIANLSAEEEAMRFSIMEAASMDRIVMDPKVDKSAFFPKFSPQGEKILSQPLLCPDGERMRVILP